MGFLRPEDLSKMGDREIFEYANETNIENWIDELKEYTIPTKIIPLNAADIDLMRKAIRCTQLGRPFPVEFDNRVEPKFLKKMKNVFDEFGSCFVRMSQRSPKDSRIAIEKGKRAFKGALESASNENERNILLVKSQKYGLRTENAQEAMELLLTSQRILDDLEDCARFHFQPSIILRKWIEIPEWAEFRGFVDEGELMGLSQYFHYCYFPEIKENEQEILDRVRKCLEKVREKLLINSCIIDFALLENAETLILELNPFFVGTDLCLFSWRKDKFKQFEFRYNKNPVNKKRLK